MIVTAGQTASFEFDTSKYTFDNANNIYMLNNPKNDPKSDPKKVFNDTSQLLILVMKK